MSNIETIKSILKKKRKELVPVVSQDTVLSSGSTLLNLAATDNPFGCFVKGGYFWFVGDSSSGKTWFTLTCLAEAARNENFDTYRFIYDNVEKGAMMDMEKYFGSKMQERLEAPAYDTEDNELHSVTVEDFYDNVDDAIEVAKEDGTPFIYILDSADGLTSVAEIDKAKEQKKARLSNKDTAGSYGDGKAKKHSENLRRLMNPLYETQSILIIISQTRDNLGFGFSTKTVSGGRALKFYAHLEIWTAVKGKITKDTKGSKRQTGVNVILKGKKNRLTGKEREVVVPIYHSFGIDDLGSCIDFLVTEKVWIKQKGKTLIDAKDFEVKMTREKLIAYIEENDLESDLQEIVGEAWNSIEEKCSISRKKRYE